MITVRCDCGEQVKVDSSFAKAQLRWKGHYAYGDHVSDPKAFVMRWLVILHRWSYTGGRIAKTTLTMMCPRCHAKHEPLILDADPEDQRK
jgi:hypothetical protein